MQRVQVHMLAGVDQLHAGQSYLLPQDLATQLIARGRAVEHFNVARSAPKFENKQTGPSEIKPVVPAEMKKSKKKR